MRNPPTKDAIRRTFQPLTAAAPRSYNRHMIGGCVQPIQNPDGSWRFVRYLLHATKGWRKA